MFIIFKMFFMRLGRLGEMNIKYGKVKIKDNIWFIYRWEDIYRGEGRTFWKTGGNILIFVCIV